MFEFRRARTESDLEAVYRLRYQVYCVERGFERAEDHPDGLERDVYDARSMHYLCFDAHGQAIGTVRLIRSAGEPFPIERHCEIESPVDTEHYAGTAEISRMAISRLYRRRAGDTIYGLTCPEKATPPPPGVERRGMPILFMGLLREIYRSSLEEGITHWYAAMERQLSILLRRYSLDFRKIGPLVTYHGERMPHLIGVREMARKVRARQPEVFDFFHEGFDADRIAEILAGTSAEALPVR
jgi:N-acyl amino acid synthase of PEP-CTERM/exosortase system